MTSSLDWSSLVPAVAATAQAAAAMVQMYWDHRRQRGARTTERDDCRCTPHQGAAHVMDTHVVRVHVSVATHTCTSVTLAVLVDVRANVASPCFVPAEECRSW